MNAPLRFCKPADDQPTCHLLLGNCSPSVGVPESSIEELLSLYGGATITLTGRSCVFASFATPAAAAAALQGLHGKPCPSVGGRVLSVSYADVRQQKGCAQPQLSAVRTSAESGVPGLVLLPEFVSEQEEAALLALVDSRPWQALAKRRVQHYGYTFHYESRNVDRSSPPANPLPGVVLPVVERLEGLPGMPKIDQLTVNEYTPGVGLAPHIDTHSAFTGPIISLSLGGPAVMVMRRGQEQRAVQLPPRSLLVMGGEARYAWQHYIPHRKSDVVAGEVVPRAPRRVSFTFRQIRGFPCDCAYPQYCDSQEGQLPPTRIAALNSQGSGDAGLTSGGGSSGGESATSSSSRSSSGTSSSHGNSKVGAQWLAHEGVLACGDGPRLDRGAAVTGKACKAGAVCAGREESVKAAMDMMSSDLGPTDGTLLNSSAATATGSDDCKGAEEASHIAGQSAHGSLHSTPSDEVHSCSLNGAESSTSSALELASVDRELQLLEEQFVHSVYNAIAPHFSSTRFAVWPKVRAFIASLPAGALVADVGCGNGKVFGVRHDIFVLGSDRSQGLAGVAARRLQPGPAAERLRADVAVADAMCLPYRPGSCDGVLCIAVLHHISSQLRRLRLLSQLLRLLVPGGRALVTVWATEQENMTKVAKWQPITTAVSAPQQPRQQQQRQEQQQLQHQLCIEAAINRAASEAPAAVPSGDYFVPWHLPLHRAEAAGAAAAAAGKAGPSILRDTSRSSLASASGRCGEAEGCPELEAQPQEAAAVASAAGSPREFPAGASSAPLLDSTKGTVVYKRYYHLFERGELDALVAQLPGARLVDSFYDKDNWCVVVEKA